MPDSHVLFISKPTGYELRLGEGDPPPVGAALEIEAARIAARRDPARVGTRGPEAVGAGDARAVVDLQAADRVRDRCSHANSHAAVPLLDRRAEPPRVVDAVSDVVVERFGAELVPRGRAGLTGGLLRDARLRPV